MAGRYAIVVLLVFTATALAQDLPALSVDLNSITFSGISSGADMATQMQVAFSSIIKGHASVGGAPYWCAQDNLVSALGPCMEHPELISNTELWAAVDYARATLSIDSPSHLSEAKVWMLYGTDDTVVHPGVENKTQDFFKHYLTGEASAMKMNVIQDAEHAWITSDFGSECDFLGKPYINNCAFDSAKEVLTFFYGDLHPMGNQTYYKTLTFSQAEYMPPLLHPSDISMASTGYVYIPPSCASGSATTCRLHVFLHGCEMSVESDGDAFYHHSGLQHWAQTNDVIVLFPQLITSATVPYNPKGCWDWWGYTGPEYATRLAPQSIALFKMMDALTGGKLSQAYSPSDFGLHGDPQVWYERTMTTIKERAELHRRIVQQLE